MANSEVIFEVLRGADGDLGVITLNRPRQLNALTLFMCVAINRQLKQWAEQKNIKAVLVTAAGDRAFCAGGDIRGIYDLCARAGRYADADNFFIQEYAMNQTIFNFPKPYIALLDGVVFGGGVGISIHGSHSVATEKLLWAMPETGIGFFPDVGVGYHLARLPGDIGRYLALTGKRLQAGAACRYGVVSAVVASRELPQLQKALLDVSWNDNAFLTVDHLLRQFHLELDKDGDKLPEQQIQHCFSAASVEEIIGYLVQSRDPWCQATAQTLMQQSPLSLKVTNVHLQHCRHFDFPQIMQENFILARHFLRDHDFIEGIRAAVVDKDHHPRWHPATLEEVPEAMIVAYYR